MFAVTRSDSRKLKLPRGEFGHIFCTRTEILTELSKKPLGCSSRIFFLISFFSLRGIQG